MEKKKVIYDENVDYDSLEQHVYEDSGDNVFYTCPICHGEYLATFITEENGQTMCIDCWGKTQEQFYYLICQIKLEII